MLPIDNTRITRKLLYVCVAVLFVVTLLLILVEPANAAPAVTLHDNDILQGGTYDRVYVGHELGVVIRDCTIGSLYVSRAVDLALIDVTCRSAVIHGYNVAIERLTCGPLVLKGEVHFIDGLYLSAPLAIVASHVRIERMNIEAPKRQPLISGWGHDVQIAGFMTWGRGALLGHVGRDWLVTNGGHHGTRLTRWGPTTYPYAYPIGDGVLLYKTR